MINRVTEDQFTYSISKGYYNHESHIHKNKKQQEKIINRSNCKKIYELLSNETHKTADINKYINYLTIIFENWESLWDFNSNFKLCRLNYDTYINKIRAIKKIVRKMTRKRQRKRKKKKHSMRSHASPQTKNNIEISKNNKSKSIKINETNTNTNKYKGTDQYSDIVKHEKINNLPLLFAFGKGNGNMTVSNTKGSGPKGPIKRIVKELSKEALVILTDEYNSSKFSYCCDKELKQSFCAKALKRKSMEYRFSVKTQKLPTFQEKM